MLQGDRKIFRDASPNLVVAQISVTKQRHNHQLQFKTPIPQYSRKKNDLQYIEIGETNGLTKSDQVHLLRKTFLAEITNFK